MLLGGGQPDSQTLRKTEEEKMNENNNSSRIQSYRDLIAWQKAMDLCVLTYQVTDSSPKHELYGLTQQARRAAVSIPSNIAEGWGRGTSLDYLRFLRTSRGSLFELQTQMLLGIRLRYISECSQITTLSDEVSRILQGLIGSLERTCGAE